MVGGDEDVAALCSAAGFKSARDAGAAIICIGSNTSTTTIRAVRLNKYILGVEVASGADDSDGATICVTVRADLRLVNLNVLI